MVVCSIFLVSRDPLRAVSREFMQAPLRCNGARQQIPRYFSLPNNPAGRIINTIAMMMKTTVDDASG
jgi:hypothetical protein